jgi:hypothetical protein
MAGGTGLGSGLNDQGVSLAGSVRQICVGVSADDQHQLRMRSRQIPIALDP